MNIDIRTKHISVIVQQGRDFFFTAYRPTEKIPHSGYGIVIGLKLIQFMVEVR